MRRLVLGEVMVHETSAKHRGAFSGSRAKRNNWRICKIEGEHLRKLKGYTVSGAIPLCIRTDYTPSNSKLGIYRAFHNALRDYKHL
jgi:hypothetical protein